MSAQVSPSAGRFQALPGQRGQGLPLAHGARGAWHPALNPAGNACPRAGLTESKRLRWPHPSPRAPPHHGDLPLGGPRRLLNLPQLPQASLFGPFLCNQSWPSPWVWSLSFSNQPQPDAHRVSQRGDHRAAGLTFCADPRLFGRPQTGCWALLLAFEAPPPSSLIAHQ